MNLASPSIVRAGRVFGTSLSRWMLVISVLLLNCERELPVVDDDSPETSGRTSAAKSNDPVVAAADNTRPDWQPAKPLDFYRIDFVRQDRAVHVDEITRLTSPLRPLPALSPEYLLVARHAGDVVAVVPLTFPTSAHSLEIGPNGEVAHSRLEVTTSSASAFVEITASIDALDLLDTKTNVVLHIDAAELPQRAGASGKVVGQSQPLTAGNLRTRYPHILFGARSKADAWMPGC